MGPTFGDVDRDGRLDLYIPDMDYGCLLLNRGEFFEDRTTPNGLAVVCGQYIGWGGILFDYDNDGYLDIYVSNGDAHKEFPDEDTLCRNDGKGNFIDVARESGEYFHHEYLSRGSTWGDIDNDGDVDLLVANINDSPRLLRNDGGNRNHWLTVEAKLPNGKSDAIGARVIVSAGGLRRSRTSSRYAGSCPKGIHDCSFGLGQSTEADDVEIHWTNGKTSKSGKVPANQFLRVVQPAE